MDPAQLSDELKRMLSLYFSHRYWKCWLLSKEGSIVFSSTSSDPAATEETALLHQLQFDTDNTFLLPASHVLNKDSSGSLVLRLFDCNSCKIIVAVQSKEALLSEPLTRLIPEQIRLLHLRTLSGSLIQRQQEKSEILEKKLAFLRQNLHSWIEVFLRDQMRKHSLHIQLSDEIYGLFESLSQQSVMQSLEQTIELQLFLHPGASSFELNADNLALQKQDIKPDTGLPGALRRAELLLDKYEESARNAQRAGLTVNGKTIARFLQPAISPPAVTDALKKNRKDIARLIREFPEKWTLLRRSLKPVKELSERY